jgi:hypothetical protein
VKRIPLIWIVIGDVTPNRGTVVAVHAGEGAGEKAEREARGRRGDVLYRPEGEAPAIGERIARDSWSGPRGAS